MKSPRIALTILALLATLCGAACKPKQAGSVKESAVTAHTAAPGKIVLRIDGSDFPAEKVAGLSVPALKPTPRTRGLLKLTRQSDGIMWEIAEMQNSAALVTPIRSGTLRGASWDSLLTELHAMPNAAIPPTPGNDSPPEHVILMQVSDGSEHQLLRASNEYQVSILLHAYPTALSVVKECMAIPKGYWFRFISPNTWGPGSETRRREVLIKDKE